MPNRILLSVLFVLALKAPLAAAPYPLHKLPLAEIRQQAGHGNAQAEYIMGVLYERGRGVEADPALAADWYRKAARQGHGRAQTNLGALYQKGKGVPRDREKALYWYRLAAKQGLSKAQYNLGLMFATRDPKTRDLQKTLYWFTEAAKRGHAQAQANLGIMFGEGLGVAPNYRLAVFWEAQAAAAGVKAARPKLEEYLGHLDVLRVKKPIVNLRRRPSTTSEIVAKLKQGQRIYRLSTSDDSAWYEVYVPQGQQMGYIAAFLVEPLAR
jgi:TPR repeat protein